MKNIIIILSKTIFNIVLRGFDKDRKHTILIID